MTRGAAEYRFRLRFRSKRPALFSALFLLTFLLFSFPNEGLAGQVQIPVRSGSEVLIEKHLLELDGKRVGILLNPSSKVGPSAFSPLLVDTLLSLGVDVRVLFAPEHGVRGNVEAGGKVADGIDPPTGLPVTSLYGSSKQPPAELLDELDVILFDIQDVGARFYTYISTMGLLMDAALPAGVDVWVLDRPNPAGGEYVSGWSLQPEFKSFVGLYPIPMVHGMTLGELALMIQGEGWAGTTENTLKVDPPAQDDPQTALSSVQNAPQTPLTSTRSPGSLRVIPMEGWTRNMLWPETGRDWIPPSPNLPSFEHAFVYLGMSLVEGTTLSEGRGTDDPFLLIGSATLNPDEASLPSFPGAQITLREFTPKRIPGKSEFPKYQDQLVQGVRIRLTDPSVYRPVESGLELLRWLLKHDPEAHTTRFLNLLAGDKQIDVYLKSDESISFPHTDFRQHREAYLLY